VRHTLFIFYGLIILVILALMSLSKTTTDKMRGTSVSFLTPLWENLADFKKNVSHSLRDSKEEKIQIMQAEIKRLEVENQLLHHALSSTQDIFHHQEKLFSTIKQLALANPKEALLLAPETEKSVRRFAENIHVDLQAIPAKVVFRSLDLWRDSLWVNIGKKNSESFPYQIGKNSPVVIGQALVGLVDYVGDYHSRVQLITNPNLVLSVRAIRGGETNFFLSSEIEDILHYLKQQRPLPFSPEQTIELSQSLHRLQKNLTLPEKTHYLAKGELHGCATFSTKQHEIVLKGTGFNFDFADEEGEARDLWLDPSLKKKESDPAVLLQLQDLLVTTGMDGVFPAGLKVALVTHISPLKEGDYYYDIKAKPLVDLFEELAFVYILPPTADLPTKAFQ
jgi:rod shape-determining protein MreC